MSEVMKRHTDSKLKSLRYEYVTVPNQEELLNQVFGLIFQEVLDINENDNKDDTTTNHASSL